MRQSTVIKSADELAAEHEARLATLKSEERAKANAEFEEERTRTEAATAERQATYDREQI